MDIDHRIKMERENIAGVIITEGNFESVVVRSTWKELYAYGDGIVDGANLYGAGGCGFYTREDVKEEFDEDDPIRILVLEKLDEHKGNE